MISLALPLTMLNARDYVRRFLAVAFPVSIKATRKRWANMTYLVRRTAPDSCISRGIQDDTIPLAAVTGRGPLPPTQLDEISQFAKDVGVANLATG